jgi:hypothetical protein
MKSRFTTIAILIVVTVGIVASSCSSSYRTCATYSKNTTPPVQKADIRG